MNRLSSMMMEQTSSSSILAPHLLIKILAFSSVKECACFAAVVCKVWNEAANSREVWSAHVGEAYPALEELLPLLSLSASSASSPSRLHPKELFRKRLQQETSPFPPRQSRIVSQAEEDRLRECAKHCFIEIVVWDKRQSVIIASSVIPLSDEIITWTVLSSYQVPLVVQNMVHIKCADLRLQARVVDVEEGMHLELIDSSNVDVEAGDPQAALPGVINKYIYGHGRRFEMEDRQFVNIETVITFNIHMNLSWKPSIPEEPPEMISINASLSVDKMIAEDFDPTELDFDSCIEVWAFLDFLLNAKKEATPMPVAAITAPLASPSSNSIGDHVLTGHDGMILENVLLHCDVPTNGTAGCVNKSWYMVANRPDTWKAQVDKRKWPTSSFLLDDGLSPKAFYHMRSEPDRLANERIRKVPANPLPSERQEKAKKHAKQAADRQYLAPFFANLYIEIQVAEKTTGLALASKLIPLRNETQAKALFNDTVKLDVNASNAQSLNVDDDTRWEVKTFVIDVEKGRVARILSPCSKSWDPIDQEEDEEKDTVTIHYVNNDLEGQIGSWPYLDTLFTFDQWLYVTTRKQQAEDDDASGGSVSLDKTLLEITTAFSAERWLWESDENPTTMEFESSIKVLKHLRMWLGAITNWS